MTDISAFTIRSIGTNRNGNSGWIYRRTATTAARTWLLQTVMSRIGAGNRQKFIVAGMFLLLTISTETTCGVCNKRSSMTFHENAHSQGQAGQTIVIPHENEAALDRNNPNGGFELERIRSAHNHSPAHQSIGQPRCQCNFPGYGHYHQPSPHLPMAVQRSRAIWGHH